MVIMAISVILSNNGIRATLPPGPCVFLQASAGALGAAQLEVEPLERSAPADRDARTVHRSAARPGAAAALGPGHAARGVGADRRPARRPGAGRWPPRPGPRQE